MSINFGTTPIAPGDLLGRLEDWVRQSAKLTADRVFLSLAPDDLHLRFPPADQFVTIFPSRFPPWQGVVTGAGQSTLDFPSDSRLGYDAEVVFTAFCRYNVDQELRASELVRNASLGLLALTTNVVAAAQFWTAPTDTDAAVSYLREYMRQSSPITTLPRNYKDTFWTLQKVAFEMKFSALFGSS